MSTDRSDSDHSKFTSLRSVYCKFAMIGLDTLPAGAAFIGSQENQKKNYLHLSHDTADGIFHTLSMLDTIRCMAMITEFILREIFNVDMHCK